MKIRVELIIEMSDEQVAAYEQEYGVGPKDLRADVKHTVADETREGYRGEQFYTSVTLKS